MNPLTQIKNTQKASKREIELGIQESASWHAEFKHSAYVFAGGLDYELTEGDLLAVFSQYGEIVDLNLIRNTDTGKSKGFVFIAYEDQRSTVLAVDNLNGAIVVGRTVRVEHVDNYKKRKAEMEGENPNSVSVDGNEGAGQKKERPQSAEPWDAGPGGDAGSRRDRSPPAAHRQPPSSEPWAAAGSIFSLLEEARQLEVTKQKSHGGDTGAKLNAPEGSGRDSAGWRSDVSRGNVGRAADLDRGRERDQDLERARSSSAGPSAALAFGPPRPPPRQAPPGHDDDLPGPGPGSARGSGRYEPDPWDRGGDPARDEREQRRHVDRGGARSERRQGRPSASPGGRSPPRGKRGSRERHGDPDRGGGEIGRKRGRDEDRGGGGEPRVWEGERSRSRSRDRKRPRSRSAERDRNRGPQLCQYDRDRGADWDWGRDRERGTRKNHR